MAQQTIILRNAGMSEMASAGVQRDPGPSHVCASDCCTYVHECAWLRRWRAVPAAVQDPTEIQFRSSDDPRSIESRSRLDLDSILLVDAEAW
jgi:hypothetical protein